MQPIIMNHVNIGPDSSKMHGLSAPVEHLHYIIQKQTIKSKCQGRRATNPNINQIVVGIMSQEFSVMLGKVDY